MQHTPAPWAALVDAHWTGLQSARRYIDIRAPAGHRIALVQHDEGDNDQAADVVLIVAAPDLLKAARAILASLDSENSTRAWLELTRVQRAERYDAAVALLHAAIAAATSVGTPA